MREYKAEHPRAKYSLKSRINDAQYIKAVESGNEQRQRELVEQAERQAKQEIDENRARIDAADGVKYSLRTGEPPKKVIYGYKAFYARDGKLYPPMVSNISDTEQKVKKATSGTMKGLETPVGVWLDADVGGIMVDENGEPVRAKTTGRLKVKNAKSGGDATLAFRPGWHLGEWPDAKQFNKDDPVTKEKRKLMPDDLVFALCEVSADVDYQLDALAYGIGETGNFSRSQAGLPMIPKDGCYKYRTNVDPTTAPWLIAGSMRVVEILDDDDCARICAEFGVKPDKRFSGKKINLAEYGLKRGPVEATAEGLERFAKNDASRANDALLQRALSDENYKDAYVLRDIDFDDPGLYSALEKELAMNGQKIEEYRKLYEERGFATDNGIRYSLKSVATKTGEKYYAEADDEKKGVIIGDDPLQWAHQTRDYINKRIRKGKDKTIATTNGVKLTITEDTAGKLVYWNSENGVKYSKSRYALKLRMALHIEDIARVSIGDKGRVPDRKSHDFAADGFSYRTSYFMDYDGKYYSLRLSIGSNGTINSIYNINKIKEAELPQGAQGTVTDFRDDGFTASDDNVPQPTKEVNGKFSFKDSDPFDELMDMDVDAGANKAAWDIVKRMQELKSQQRTDEYGSWKANISAMADSLLSETGSSHFTKQQLTQRLTRVFERLDGEKGLTAEGYVREALDEIRGIATEMLSDSAYDETLDQVREALRGGINVTQDQLRELGGTSEQRDFRRADFGLAAIKKGCHQAARGGSGVSRWTPCRIRTRWKRRPGSRPGRFCRCR